MVYNRLLPGYHYKYRTDPKSIVKWFDAFDDKEVELGKRRSKGNRLGRIEFRRFEFDDVKCVGFSEYWGQSAGDRSSAGTNMLYGYYCADPGRGLSDEAILATVKGLNVTD